jgi:hypothetical protein
MTRLRQVMLEELEPRNYDQGTIRYYLRSVEQYARTLDPTFCTALHISLLPVKSALIRLALSLRARLLHRIHNRCRLVLTRNRIQYP